LEAHFADHDRAAQAWIARHGGCVEPAGADRNDTLTVRASPAPPEMLNKVLIFGRFSMLLAALAAAAIAGQPLAAPRIDASEPTAAAARRAEAKVVYLGCQIALTSLTDCKVVNDGPVDAAAAATALRLSRQMSVPEGLAQRTGGHILVKLDVTP
jgi:hypothetical protein